MERLAREYTVKEIICVARLDEDDPTKIVYLKVKAFIPSDKSIECKIEDFENGQVIFLRGKFVACEGWYTVRPHVLLLFLYSSTFRFLN